MINTIKVGEKGYYLPQNNTSQKTTLLVNATPTLSIF